VHRLWTASCWSCSSSSPPQSATPLVNQNPGCTVGAPRASLEVTPTPLAAALRLRLGLKLGLRQPWKGIWRPVQPRRGQRTAARQEQPASHSERPLPEAPDPTGAALSGPLSPFPPPPTPASRSRGRGRGRGRRPREGIPLTGGAGGAFTASVGGGICSRMVRAPCWGDCPSAGSWIPWAQSHSEAPDCPQSEPWLPYDCPTSLKPNCRSALVP